LCAAAQAAFAVQLAGSARACAARSARKSGRHITFPAAAPRTARRES